MILGVSVGYAQSSIKWLCDEFNFGAFKEDSGLVTCQFKGVNVSDEHVAIIRARATCGCTTPQYSSSAFAPGDTITVTVSYDPEGRPGRFMKKVYIKPELEIFEVEPAGVMLLGSSLNMGGDTDGDGVEDRVNPDDPESDFEEFSNKRNPWGKSPWE